MPHQVVAEIAESLPALAALHHLAVAVLLTIFWIRRRSMERPIAIYFAVAFITAAAALATRVETLLLAVISLALGVLWITEAVKVRTRIELNRTPKFRLLIVAALWVFAYVYPGHSGQLPSFLFSSLGVTLAPTLIAALATLDAAAPFTNRRLHWSLAGAGVLVGVLGLVSGSMVYLPLLVAAGYAIPLLLGRAKVLEPRTPAETSVRAVTDRIHKRRVLLTRARRSSSHKLDIRKRR
jgi:hypothetical protein